MLLTLQHVASRVLRDPDHRFGWVSLEYLLDGWVQYDGHDYLRIAEGGYWYVPGVESPVVWFPLYPLAIRSVGWVLDDPMLAGMVVASIGGLVGVGVYWKWLDRSGITGDARLVAFLFLVTYPYGWYLYGVVYADSVFVALVLCSFLLVEQGRHVLAGIAGAPATATRPTGLALIPALAVLAVERAGVLTVPAVVGEGRVGRAVQRFRIPTSFDRSRFRPLLLGPLLAEVGVGSYMVYLGVRFGDPLAFVTNQRAYHPGSLPMLKLAYHAGLRDLADDPTYALTTTAQAFVAVVLAVSVPFVGRRFGWGYAVFTAVLLAIPILRHRELHGHRPLLDGRVPRRGAARRAARGPPRPVGVALVQRHGHGAAQHGLRPQLVPDLTTAHPSAPWARRARRSRLSRRTPRRTRHRPVPRASGRRSRSA